MGNGPAARAGATLAALAALAASAAPAALAALVLAAADAPATGAAPREGEVLDRAGLLARRDLLPPEVWRHRERFFGAGVRLQVGPHQRAYPVPRTFREATARGAGGARLDAAGNLAGHVPGQGLPFPPAAIDPAAPDAALRWAWNAARRHRGAGPRGSFQLVDLPGRVGRPQVYRGEWFQLVGGDAEASFVAGGRFESPAPVRHLAWRQRRPLAASGDPGLLDEIFLYLPDARKVRRASGAGVDGLFAPNYRTPTGSAASGGAARGGSLAATAPVRRGWLGLALRPNAYVWRWEGERDVLAPLNVARSGYPLAPGRDWGPSGLSAADDRWELRRAVVIQGARQASDDGIAALTLYIDAQTQQPLYFATRGVDGRLVETGILLHRFSDDVAGYPAGPGGTPASVFDPVAAVFVDGTGSGWRRESYDVVSTPPSEAERRRLTSPGYLSRGR